MIGCHETVMHLFPSASVVMARAQSNVMKRFFRESSRDKQLDRALGLVNHSNFDFEDIPAAEIGNVIEQGVD